MTVSFEQSLATLTVNWWHFIISVLVTLWKWYQACPALLHTSVAHWTLQCDGVVFKLVNKQLNNNDFIQGELYWFSTFSTKYCSKSAFFGVFQILMILHKSVCTAQNHQSLLVPLFSIVYTKIGWQFCTHLQSHKVKENVQFYKSYQKRLMILHYAYNFVQNHQSLR